MKIDNIYLDINKAKREYELAKAGIPRSTLGCFSHYSPSYVLTNEDIRWVSGLTKNDAKKVLTVAGSGDQPMFYAMNGADTVDTFDISFCAKAAMDIKSSAIKKLSRDEYIKMIFDMHSSDKLSAIQGIEKVATSLPNNTAQFIKSMDEYPIFSNGISPEYYTHILPTNEEFESMKARISKPFKFIWSDLGSLHKHLTAEYDVINLSNILEYMTPEQISKTLVSLRNHIRPKGYIIAQTGSFGINRNREALYDASQKFKHWSKIGLLQKDKKDVSSELIAVLQRTR